MMKSDAFIVLGLGCLTGIYPAHGMGLRSFVALPVEKNGAVIRFAFEHANEPNTDVLSTSAAYGLNAGQTLLLGVPYRLSPSGADQQGDLSLLYRHIVWQKNRLSGTSRLGLLGGAITPAGSDRNAAIQTGFVFTHFKGRHEIDVDALYQAGIENRPDSGRYDISWQYRLSPAEFPDWGIPSGLNSVLELNGRWDTVSGSVQQVTTGLQWVHRKWVIEGGITQDLNVTKDLSYLLSTRFHF